MSDLSQKAKELVGEQEPDDYIINPTAHAALFAEKAPLLSRVLGSSRVLTTAEQYANADAKAKQWQKDFNRVFKRANMMVFLTGFLAAALTATATIGGEGDTPDAYATYLRILLTLAGIISGAVAAKYLRDIKDGKLMGQWTTWRAKAEAYRLKYFQEVAGCPVEADKKDLLFLGFLKLHYFLRYQLGVQLAYFRTRGEEHGKEAGKLLSLGGWSLVGASIATGAAGVLGTWGNAWAAIGVLGVIFTGLGSLVSMRESVHQDRKNSERYASNFDALLELKKKLDRVEEAIEKEDPKVLGLFVGAINDRLALEHRQWLKDMDESYMAVEALENKLKEYDSKEQDKT